MGKLIQKVTTILRKKKRTISVAESCTGGLLSHKLTSISGSSIYFKLGIIAYSNKAKVKQLKIPRHLIQKYGAVSKKIASLMAKNIKNISGVDISISATGIAGPTGGSPEKPVGLVYIALTSNEGTRCKKINLKGNRLENINSTVKEALLMLKKEI